MELGAYYELQCVDTDYMGEYNRIVKDCLIKTQAYFSKAASSRGSLSGFVVPSSLSVIVFFITN